jgi:hypothetical protein
MKGTSARECEGFTKVPGMCILATRNISGICYLGGLLFWFMVWGLVDCDAAAIARPEFDTRSVRPSYRNG